MGKWMKFAFLTTFVIWELGKIAPAKSRSLVSYRWRLGRLQKTHSGTDTGLLGPRTPLMPQASPMSATCLTDLSWGLMRSCLKSTVKPLEGNYRLKSHSTEFGRWEEFWITKLWSGCSRWLLKMLFYWYSITATFRHWTHLWDKFFLRPQHLTVTLEQSQRLWRIVCNHLGVC